MDNAVEERQKTWKQRKNGGTKEEYLKAKKAVKTAVYFAKRDAETEQFASINNESDKNRIFKMTKRLKGDNNDVVGERCVKNDDGKLTLTVDDKLKAWQSHYQKVLNVEFPWNAVNMCGETPVEGPAIKVAPEMVSKEISKIKSGKAAGPSGIIIEIIKAAGDGTIVCLTSLLNHIMYTGRVPNDWHLSYIINLFKGKGDAFISWKLKRS